MANQIGAKIFSSGWRTGSAISAELTTVLLTPIVSMGRSDLARRLEAENNVALIVSQCCDLVAPSFVAEPYVELAIGCPIEKAQPQNRRLRSTRVLEVISMNGECFQLNASDRVMIDRSLLLDKAPDESKSLPAREAKLIQRWLFRRYGRHAFPNELVVRLDFRNDREAKRILSRLRDNLIQLRLTVAPEDEELEKERPYQVMVTCVGDLEGLDEKTKTQLEEDFDSLKNWITTRTGIEVKAFDLIDQHDFTFADMQDSFEWMLDDFTIDGSNCDDANGADPIGVSLSE